MDTVSLRTVPMAKVTQCHCSANPDAMIQNELEMGLWPHPAVKGHNLLPPTGGGAGPQGSTHTPGGGVHQRPPKQVPATLTLLIPSSGNYFYVSMPTEPPQTLDPDPIPPPSPPRGSPQEAPTHPSPTEGSLDPPAPLRDVDLIFRTIEQLTLKLNRLKVSSPNWGKLGGGVSCHGVMEGGGHGPRPQTCAHPSDLTPFLPGTLQAVETAHRELLQSLGRSSSTDATPLGGSAPEMDGWSQQPPNPDGDSPLARALRSLQGPTTNAPGKTHRPAVLAPPIPSPPCPPHPLLPISSRL